MARWGRRFHQLPIVPKGLTGANAPAIPPGEFLGLVVQARPANQRAHQRRTLIVPQPIVGAAVPPVTLPNYPGLVVMAPKRNRRRSFAGMILPRMALVPTAGFIGPKTGFLTVAPYRGRLSFQVAGYRSVSDFTVKG